MVQKLSSTASSMVAKGVPALDAFAVISNGLAYLRIREEEMTKRAYIAEQRRVLLAAIMSERAMIEQFMDHRFAERKAALGKFFTILQQGVDSRDHQIIDRSLQGILGILQENPLAELESFRTQWKQDSFVIDL